MIDMKYVDIKDQVVRTTNNMECVPVDVIQALIDNYLGYWEWMNLWEVRNREHPSIKCVVHADMRGRTHNCIVCTVVVDTIAAFFFVSSSTSGSDSTDWEWDTHYYILCAPACRRFSTYIVRMAVQIAFDTIEPEHGETEVAEDIPALSTFSGGEVLYGKEYSYIRDNWV